jgi:hypothetical protein
MFAVPSKPWVVGHHLILLHHTLQWESKNVATPDPSKLIKLVRSAGWSLLRVSKWGENVKSSWPVCYRSVDGILVKRYCRIKGLRTLLPNSRVIWRQSWKDLGELFRSRHWRRNSSLNIRLVIFHPSFIFLSLVFSSGNPDDSRREESWKGEEEERNWWVEEEKGEIRSNFQLDIAGLPGKLARPVNSVIFLYFIKKFWLDAELYVKVLNLFT